MRFDIAAAIRRPSGVTIEVAIRCEADAVGLVGPSGSGKTTVLEAIAGIEPGARVILGDQDCSSLPIHRRGVGYVTQDALLFPHLSVRANLLYSPAATALGELPAMLGIDHLLDRMPRHLSGGERRRVALARAILSRPRLLLLDEPFAGLDEPRRRDALSLLDRVRKRHAIPLMLVSHAADEVLALTEWIVRLDEGRVAKVGAGASILRWDETRIDNYMTGIVVGPGRVKVGPWELGVILPPGWAGEVRLACAASDILLAGHPPAEISARNCLPARVASIDRAGAAVLVTLDGKQRFSVTLEAPTLRALVTREAADALGLAPGVAVTAVIKTTSIAVLGP